MSHDLSTGASNDIGISSSTRRKKSMGLRVKSPLQHVAIYVLRRNHVRYNKPQNETKFQRLQTVNNMLILCLQAKTKPWYMRIYMRNTEAQSS